MSPLASLRLAQDARVLQAKALLIEAVKEHQKSIVGIKPPDASLVEEYESVIKRFGQMRGSPLWYPYLGSGIGNGSFVELLDGSVKYDFINGIGVHYFGHSNTMLIEAGIEAAISNTILQGNLQQNKESVTFSSLLLEASGLDHCFLTTSGAMANENALKIAFQKNAPASRILAFDRTFTGRTLALSQITDKPAFRVGLPSTLSVDYLPFYNPEKPEESTALAVATLKKHIARYPKKHAAMVFELVQGEGGAYPGSPSFFKALMEILKEHHIAIIADEVQTFGRTERLFAFQHFELEKYVDIVTVGKLSLVCATLFTKEYLPMSGLLSQTFTSSTASIRAAIAVVSALLEGNFFGPNGKNRLMHTHFAMRLEALQKKYPDRIKGPFGIGGMVAFTPFNGEADRAAEFCQKLFQKGVLSFVAGAHPTRVRFLLPVGAITKEEIDEVATIIESLLIG